MRWAILVFVLLYTRRDVVGARSWLSDWVGRSCEMAYGSVLENVSSLGVGDTVVCKIPSMG